jgi:hypothetical protein
MADEKTPKDDLNRAAWGGKTLPGISREREMALRTSVNMVLYSLAGTFKGDPIQKVLEKLDR